MRERLRDESGQALVAVLIVLGLVLLLAGGLGAIARALSIQGEHARAADLAALAGARAMLEAQPRLFEPAVIDGRLNPRHLGKDEYLEIGKRAAEETARRNGAQDVLVSFPDSDELAPRRIVVTVRDAIKVGDKRVPGKAEAEAEVVVVTAPSVGASLAGEYRGPLVERQGELMRPDVALAFDRMAAAAAKDGVHLLIESAYRSDAEQAVLFARRPDPKWVAPPGKSLHRLGTELDLKPPSAWPWLRRNAQRFGFVQRYSWEPWHWGYVRSPGSRSVGFGAPDGKRAVPSFVPDWLAPILRRASQRWGVSAALLAAQLYQESTFNPFAKSEAGAMGIAQFMPETARAYGLRNPYDVEQAVMAQAHYMRDLLGQFGSVPLALAAYNAGPGNVRRYGGIPPFPETQSYVASILALLGGAGHPVLGAGLEVRLVR